MYINGSWQNKSEYEAVGVLITLGDPEAIARTFSRGCQEIWRTADSWWRTPTRVKRATKIEHSHRKRLQGSLCMGRRAGIFLRMWEEDHSWEIEAGKNEPTSRNRALSHMKIQHGLRKYWELVLNQRLEMDWMDALRTFDRSAWPRSGCRHWTKSLWALVE